MRKKQCLAPFFMTLISFVGFGLSASAQDALSPQTGPSPHSISAASEESGTQLVRKSKGKIPREKEAEGTQAPNRFGADIIIKSRYELNGQPLEVDTD